MNEISRCCRVLNVKPGASLEEVKEAYRDLVQVWHPDRFSEKERLQNRAQEQLKEINLAYEYLTANAFQDGFLVEPPEEKEIGAQEVEPTTAQDPASSQTGSSGAEPPFDSPDQAAQPGAARKTLWVSVGLAAILAGLVTLYLKSHNRAQNAGPIQSSNISAISVTNPAADQASTTETEPAPGNSFPRLYPFANDILASNTETNQDGWLESRYLVTPPITLRLSVHLTDLVDFRVSFALGRLIFNWSEHPKELRIHDPRGWTAAGVPDQGLLLPKQTHKIVWEIATNRMSVSVDGQIRYETNGNYEGIKGFPGVKPCNGSVKIESFVLETPHPMEEIAGKSTERIPVAGDLLSTMVPDQGFQVTSEPDGIVLMSASETGKRLMTTETYQPPFTIRVRAKTDSQNLRLYCGAGTAIFNWERDFRELRVHDPLTGQQIGLRDKGLISPNDWHVFIWDVQRTGMRLSVDGVVRFSNRKDYHTLNATVGVGQYRSKVTVEYFQVQK